MIQEKTMRMFGFFGRKAQYSALSWWENFMGGHLNIGKNITIFGENAMHWAIQIHTKKYGYIVFTLPVKTFGKYFGCHLYCSPNGTPWASTYYKSIWKENNVGEELRAKLRKLKFGHNFDTDIHADELDNINDNYSNLMIREELNKNKK